MQMASRKLGEFFNIGRDRGWDVARQVWTVHSLVDPEGRVLTLGDVLDGIPLDLRLEKSGSRYGYPPLRQRIVESQRYGVTPEHVLVTSGTQHANFLAFAATLEVCDDAGLCERLGIPVTVVRGSERAMKVTEEPDFARAEALSTLPE